MAKQFTPPLEEFFDFQVATRQFGDAAVAKPLVMASNDVRFLVAEHLPAIGVDADIARFEDVYGR